MFTEAAGSRIIWHGINGPKEIVFRLTIVYIVLIFHLYTHCKDI
jgi:hypothetical protein